MHGDSLHFTAVRQNTYVVFAPHKAVEDMCLHKMADRLYERLQAQCDLHIAAELQRLSGSQIIEAVVFLEQVRPSGPAPLAAHPICSSAGGVFHAPS